MPPLPAPPLPRSPEERIYLCSFSLSRSGAHNPPPFPPLPKGPARPRLAKPLSLGFAFFLSLFPPSPSSAFANPRRAIPSRVFPPKMKGNFMIAFIFHSGVLFLFSSQFLESVVIVATWCNILFLISSNSRRHLEFRGIPFFCVCECARALFLISVSLFSRLRREPSLRKRAGATRGRQHNVAIASRFHSRAPRTKEEFGPGRPIGCAATGAGRGCGGSDARRPTTPQRRLPSVSLSLSLRRRRIYRVENGFARPSAEGRETPNILLSTLETRGHPTFWPEETRAVPKKAPPPSTPLTPEFFLIEVNVHSYSDYRKHKARQMYIVISSRSFAVLGE